MTSSQSLAEARALIAQAQQQANEQVAGLIEEINAKLRQIGSIVREHGISVDLYETLSIADDVDTENDWSSSSIGC